MFLLNITEISLVTLHCRHLLFIVMNIEEFGCVNVEKKVRNFANLSHKYYLT